MLSPFVFAALLAAPQGPQFAPPERVAGNGTPIALESPGCACPCWHDVDGDGRRDLVVGQFAKGRIMVWPGKADGSLGAGRWLEADGKAVEIPGVW